MRLEFPMSISASKQQAVLRAYQQVTRNAPREVAVVAFIVRGCVLIEATATLPLAAWEVPLHPLCVCVLRCVVSCVCMYDAGASHRCRQLTYTSPIERDGASATGQSRSRVDPYHRHGASRSGTPSSC